VLGADMGIAQDQLPDIMIPDRRALGRLSSDSGMSSPVSPSSRGTDLEESSPTTGQSMRGPWDHSSSIKISIDVSAVLPLPKPAALGSTVVR
jgi:hypothetical protein